MLVQKPQQNTHTPTRDRVARYSGQFELIMVLPSVSFVLVKLGALGNTLIIYVQTHRRSNGSHSNSK